MIHWIHKILASWIWIRISKNIRIQEIATKKKKLKMFKPKFELMN